MKRETKSRMAPKEFLAPKPLPNDYPWKILSTLVEDLSIYLSEDEVWLITHIARKRDLESYTTLSEIWGLQCIDPQKASLAETRAKYLLASVIKKFRFDTDKEARKQAALDVFLDAEETCYEYNQRGFKVLLDANGMPTPELRDMRTFLSELLGHEVIGAGFMDDARHGPGANLDTSGKLSGAYHKYHCWPYSCTIGAYRYARFLIETDQRWYGALQNSYREAKDIPMHLPLNMKKFWKDVISITDENRISFVPKDAHKERTIAIEPALNLMLQLGVDGFIRKRLTRYGVDLNDQRKNQELARIGSLDDGPNSYVTIDLSAASDSLSLKLCELLLPPDWFSLLVALRCPRGSIGKRKFRYSKISSMGNGFTFALESAIFLAIIVASIKAEGGRYTSRHVAVFGDDLIVQKQYVPKVISLLANCGFTINIPKTFVSGPVRESCGTDWLLGKSLRPVFLTETPLSLQDLFTDINRLGRILSLRFGIDDSKTSELLCKWVPDKAKSLTGPLSDEDFDSYRHVRDFKSPKVYDVYKYYRLISTPIPQKGDDFHMRKLMTDLRGASAVPNLRKHNARYLRDVIDRGLGLLSAPILKWQRKRITSGSRFTVTDRTSFTVRLTYSISDTWRQTYAEYMPFENRHSPVNSPKT